MKNKLVSSSFYRLTEKIVAVATSLILTPILITQLGTDDYGLWILVLASLGWFNVFELGCPTALQREQAIAIERRADHELNELFSSAIVLFAGLGLFAVGGVFFLAMKPSSLGVSLDNASLASMALHILAFKVFWDFVANAAHGVYSGHIRFDIDAKINTISTLVKSVAMLMLAAPYGVMGLVFATVVLDVVTQLVKFVIAFKLHSALRFSFGLVSLQAITRVFRFSRFIIIYDLSRILNSKSSPLLASHLFNLSAVAVFNIADRLARQVETAIVSLLGVFQPYFVRESEKQGDVEGKLFLVVDIFCFFTSILFVPLMLLSPSFIQLWVGDGFSQSSDILQVLCLAFLTKAISTPVMDVLIAQSKHQTVSVNVFIGALINVGFAILFGHMFGLIGIAFAFLLSQIVFEGLGFCIHSRAISARCRIILLVKFVRVLGFYSLCYGINQSFHLIADQYDWLTFIFVALACGFCVTVACWYLFLERPMRRLLIDQCKRAVNKE